jgi:hypothetical protein
VTTARIRWIPPVILCLAIFGFTTLQVTQALWFGFNNQFQVISWTEFICGPLAALIAACGLFGSFLYRKQKHFQTMVVWFLTGMLILAARPFVMRLFTG